MYARHLRVACQAIALVRILQESLGTRDDAKGRAALDEPCELPHEHGAEKQAIEEYGRDTDQRAFE
jgi:hypothetical protein